VLRLSAGRAGAELERLQAAEGLQNALTEVQRLKDRLQEENVYLRRELIANVSHDLRSPLASLRGYLDTLLLKEQTLSACERRSYLSIASRQTEHLQGLIDELFELARLDFQGYRIAAEPVQLGELAGDVVQKFQLAAQAKGVMLGAEAGAELPFVHADIALIERAISNLIDNALAHTPSGGCVELSLWAERPTQVTVSVRDSGRGIAAEDLPHVFERFYRADKARRRSVGGSGLGLAIVKRIVELHGGQVQVESREGEGARFWFSLRAAA
jgi:signal transduction histidine kinase